MIHLLNTLKNIYSIYTHTHTHTHTHIHTHTHTHAHTKVRDEAVKAGRLPMKESVWSYFIQKCSNNLHIVLCMSPVGDTLKTRCRNFPGLVNNVSIDWFTAWPKQALHAVASQFLADVRKPWEERIGAH